MGHQILEDHFDTETADTNINMYKSGFDIYPDDEESPRGIFEWAMKHCGFMKWHEA